jgi:formylglycine-generating enzyme required for sulfatase activity
MKFVWIPSGTFLMGSTRKEIEEQPFDLLAAWCDETQHKVTLRRPTP